jgi:hypothetical protein
MMWLLGSQQTGGPFASRLLPALQRYAGTARRDDRNNKLPAANSVSFKQDIKNFVCFDI